MDSKRKWEKADKKEIEKRLRLSNKKKWNNLLLVERQAVIDKYYDLRSIDHLGLEKVLDDNRDMRRSFVFLFLGLLLGVFGSLFADIMMRYAPNNLPFNIFMLLLLSFFFWRIVHEMDNMSAEHLYQEDVLDHLLILIKKDQKNKR